MQHSAAEIPASKTLDSAALKNVPCTRVTARYSATSRSLPLIRSRATRDLDWSKRDYVVSRPRSVTFSLTSQVQSILVAHFQPAVHFIVFLKLGLRVRLEMIGDVIFHHPLPQPFQLCFFSGADSRRAQPGQAWPEVTDSYFVPFSNSLLSGI